MIQSDLTVHLYFIIWAAPEAMCCVPKLLMAVHNTPHVQTVGLICVTSQADTRRSSESLV